MVSKKKTIRGEEKYPGLRKNVNLKIRQEHMDQDYIHKLNDKEKEWLDKFNREYISADFTHGKKILHKTKELKKSVYDSNNARNRDALSITKINGMLDGDKKIKEDLNTSTNLHEVEDTLNTIIDLKKKAKRLAKT